MNRTDTDEDAAAVIAATRAWLERAVIGLDLCPFAGAVHLGNRIRWCVSAARTPEALLDDLARELLALQNADPQDCETTLLIHPRVLGDFPDFNDFLDAADGALEELGLEGEIQVASFHPQYRFAGTGPDEIGNFTNRSPYPTLHLLREASIERALAACSDTDAIYEKNIRTLRGLGIDGWRRLWLDEPPSSTD